MRIFFKTQPPAFQMIFLLEIWERFGFYMVQGILTLYFIRTLAFSDVLAYYTFGAFSALVFGMTALGGYLGDNVLGPKRSIVLGLIVLALGYLGLALANSNNLFWALSLICVGSGIFKANPSNLLSKCYEPQDSRLHSGFTLYYMAVNLGSLVALLVGPAVALQFGYAYAYLLSFIGICLGLGNYLFQYRLIADINNAADMRSVSGGVWCSVIMSVLLLTIGAHYLLQHVLDTSILLLLVTVLILGVYVRFGFNEVRAVQIRMGVALILMGEAIGFFILYQQMPTSLTLFAVHNVRATLWGFSFDPQSFQSLNPFWIILFSPLLAGLYTRIQKKKVNFATPYKFAAGMLCCGLSFFILYFARYFHDEFGFVSAWWLVASYSLQSLGELLVSALGVAMVAELVPASMTGFVMGMWFLTSAIAGILGAVVASFTALPPHLESGEASLMIYTGIFAQIGIITLLIGLVMTLFAQMLSGYFRENSCV